MDAILPVFIAVLLAETGGRVQAVAHQLGGTFSNIKLILGALALTTIIGLLVGAAGGAWAATLINFQARTLLAGLALIFAGLPMLLKVKPAKPVSSERPFGASALSFARAQFGDASQFIVFAFAARADMAGLALGGGFAAVMVAASPPLLLREEWPGALPIALLRRLAAVLLTGTGLWLGLRALHII